MTENSRRDFLKKLGISATTLSAFSFWNITEIKAASERLSQEDFWEMIRRSYQQSSDFINLENGYFSPQPLEVLRAHSEYQEMINRIPSYYMRTRQFEEREEVKEKLASLAGVSKEEIVITRNTTESLDTIILGLKMKKGDEAIMTDQDYLSMVEAFRQRARRDGIVNKMISLPLLPKSDEEIVEVYEKAITKRTKVMLVTHLINITGQVLPVKKICDMAHSYGVEVICDSAHAFAQLDFKIPDLNCDYFGCSLHKWLCTPLGMGLLYVKKENIEKVWPLFGDDTYADNDIRKFEHLGTQPVHTHLALSNAIDFHLAIGATKKEKRLKSLRKYWTDKVKDNQKVTLNMPLEDSRASALGNIAIDGYSPSELAVYFMEKHKIFTVAIDRQTVKGVRVTPHLYTTYEELDKFVRAVEQA